uniref:Uncharacterized protein n=1 Tax=Setaria italica TaxID=4555 RepID=K3YF88_SETIT
MAYWHGPDGSTMNGTLELGLDSSSCLLSSSSTRVVDDRLHLSL